MSLGNWLRPLRRRQLFCAASASLKIIASAVLFERHPFDLAVRCRTVAKELSMMLLTGMIFPGARRPRCDEVIVVYGATIRDRGTGSTKVRAGRSVR